MVKKGQLIHVTNVSTALAYNTHPHTHTDPPTQRDRDTERESRGSGGKWKVGRRKKRSVETEKRHIVLVTVGSRFDFSLALI